jgi:glyoxylase-like metal-dependent hydrolase (beta-lactamase superfamily II)
MMRARTRKIGSRGLLFIFPDYRPFHPDVPLSIQIYVINGDKHLFICDTGMVPDQMESIKLYLKEQNLDSKPIVIFNTHHHHDHRAGNHVIDSAQIVSHELCRENLLKQIKENAGQKTKIKLPNQVFKDKLMYQEDNVEFFHSPGHSEDCSTCYDYVDQVLFVGDNLVDPLPLPTWHKLDTYLESLDVYNDSEAQTIVLGHNLVLKDKSFVKNTMEYIENFRNFNVDISNFTKIHSAFYRWSYYLVGMSLKNNGDESKALEFLNHLKTQLYLPEIRPENKVELAQFEKMLN